jgi:hypothetical protein
MILDKLREQEAVIKRLVEAITKLITQQAAPPPPLPVAGPDVLYAGWQKPAAAMGAPVETKQVPDHPQSEGGEPLGPPLAAQGLGGKFWWLLGR